VLREDQAAMTTWDRLQGFIGLREFVADKLNRHRGMSIGRDEVLITTGSGRASTDQPDVR
jgi:DNA-binding transcriptional MocR family regulator